MQPQLCLYMVHMDSRIAAIFGIVAALAVAAGISVMAVSQDDVTLNSPATGTWVGSQNYTTGFNFSWQDSDDYSYNTANCTLYIGDYDNPADTGTIMHTEICNRDNITATYKFYQDSNVILASNTVRQYWTVKCFNQTKTPTSGWAPATRVLYYKNVTPQYQVSSYSFANATMQASCSGWFHLNVTDASTMYGYEFTYNIVNASNGVSLGSGSGANVTPVNVSFAMPAPNTYSINISVEDHAGNRNYTLNDYSFVCDDVAPVVTFVTPTPTNASIRSQNWAYINFTVVDPNNDTITLKLNKNSITTWGANCTSYTGMEHCHFNFTGLAEAHNIIVNVTVVDTATNSYTTDNRYFTYDVTAPASVTARNFTVSASAAAYNFSTTEISPNYCTALMWNYTPKLVTTLTGSMVVGALTECYGTFTGANIGVGGAFTVQVNITDDVVQSTTSNKTGVIKKLYEGWNILTWTEGATTALALCQRVANCEQVSWYNNSAGTFITYSSANPDVYNATAIGMAEGALIYVNASDYLIMNRHMPGSGKAAENLTVSDAYWYMMGTLGASSLQTVMDEPAMNGSTVTGIIKASLYNGTKFLTCDDGYQLCTATSNLPSAVTFQMGDALWVLANDTMTFNRSVDS